MTIYNLSYQGHLNLAISMIKEKITRKKIYDLLIKRGNTRQKAQIIIKHASVIIKNEKVKLKEMVNT